MGSRSLGFGLHLKLSGLMGVAAMGWFSILAVQIVLLSVSPKDATGPPSPERLEAVQGYNLLRIDRNGWIELSTGGEPIWVDVAQ